MGGGRPTEKGDVDAAFREAAAIIEGTYEAQTRLHCCLETHGHVCKWDGDQLTVWASTQAVTGMKGAFSAPARTRIICEHMGGGFGSKFGPGPEGQACAELARMANAPVKLMLTRDDEQVVSYRGPGVRAQIKLAAAADGTLLASEVRHSGLGGVAMNVGTPLGQGFYIVAPQALRVWQDTILTHAAGTAALRAPGHPQASWCWECALDDLAAKLNMDPLELRRKNHNDPVRRAEWDKAARLIGWERRNKTPGAGGGILKRGMGMASATWGGGGGPGSGVDVVIGRDGTITTSCGTQDIGTGTRTYVAAILAEELGLDFKDIHSRIGDTQFPPGAASGGSQTAASVAPAAKVAAVDARKKLLAIAARSPAFNVNPEEADEKLAFVYPGKIQQKGSPGKSITFKQLCGMLPPEGLKAGGMILDEPNHRALAQGGVAGCCFAEVEVDTETGKVRPVKIVSLQDCGLVLNRLQAESQVIGAITQGIAQALLEYRQMDNLTGRMLNPNLEEYKLTHAREFPEIYVEIFDNPIGKVSGIGEPPVIPVAAAIGNAVFNATGARVPDAPITPDKVLRALAQRRGGAS
jgi:xanthine dehydrogenase YagR molybdenum-binding subunit